MWSLYPQGRKTRHRPPGRVQSQHVLELEPRGKVQLAVAGSVLRAAKRGAIRQLPISIEVQVQLGVVVGERVQWVVQEVVGCGAKLKALFFADRERLENGQVAIEVRGSFDVGKHDVAVIAGSQGGG